MAWIYDLGEAQIGERKLIDYLSLRSGLSYWWMSSLAQKFNASGYSQIDNAIKALALEMLVARRQATSIVFISANHRLADCLQAMCQIKSIHYEWRQIKISTTKHNTFTLYQSLPHVWQAFIYLVWYAIKNVPFLLKKRSAMPEHTGEVMFIDVLVHLDKKAISTGIFSSNYWTALVGKLSEWQVKSNWLHIFFRHPAISSPTKAQNQINRFNEASSGSQFHALIERSLSFGILVRVMGDYFRVSRSYALLSNFNSIRPINSDLNLWPLHAEECVGSFCGKAAMINCLRALLIEEAVSRFPQQRLGIYISENQPWEMALVHAWKAAGHGILVGAPHTAIRFWDLRYHYDARSFLNNREFPLPDVLAVNGSVARRNVMASGYPSGRIVEVEALRFLHLHSSCLGHAASRSTKNELRVLICGDFLAETNRRILAWLEIAAKSLSHDTVYVFKPHPAYPLNSADYPALELKMSEAPLADLLPECDVVFTSNITSAAVDAYSSGISVVQMLDGNTFNMSPLRGLQGVAYVTNPIELAEALENAKYRKLAVADPYFYLNDALPRWRRLINSVVLSPTNNLYDI